MPYDLVTDINILNIKSQFSGWWHQWWCGEEGSSMKCWYPATSLSSMTTQKTMY